MDTNTSQNPSIDCAIKIRVDFGAKSDAFTNQRKKHNRSNTKATSMAGTRDIRSFFGGGPATKKQKVAEPARTVTDASASPAASVAVSAELVEDTNAKVAENAVATTRDGINDDKLANTKDAASVAVVVVATADDDNDDQPITHSFGNLQRNAKVLMHASWYEQLEKEFSRAYFTSLTKFLAREENRWATCQCHLWMTCS